jgi:carboxypeptidase T
MRSRLRYPWAVLMIAAVVFPSYVRSEVVTVPYKGSAQIADFQARGIEILARTKYGIDVLAEGAALEYLRTRPYPISIQVEKPDRTQEALDANLGQYHTYAETEALLGTLVSTYPAIAKKSIIGTSLQARYITALKISDNVAVDEDEPEVLYMGDHHARELMSVEIPLLFAQYLLQNYGVNSTVTNYVNTREIYIIPMVNPDGHFYVQQNHAGSPNTWWRKNRRDNLDGFFGVDLNRNYAYQWGFDDVGSSPQTSSDIYRGAYEFSEPETQAIRNFVDSRHFTTWFSYHSYGELLLYSWGYIYANTPDHPAMSALADSLVLENGYLAGNPASGAIYITNGDSDDWGYGEQVEKNKIFAYTPEINSAAQGGFGPAEALITPTFNLLLPMNMKLLKFADNPYRVVGPWAPDQDPATDPYNNAITRISWAPQDPDDPNPAVSYSIEGCLNPTTFTDPATPALTGWVGGGFTYNATGFSGPGYFSGNSNNLVSTLTMALPLMIDAAADTLRFKVNYNTESNYDYGYVDVSTDGGSSWTPIPGNITTMFNPFGSNRGNGFTGVSPGWVDAIFPLTAYLGEDIFVRISYITDGGVLGAGVRVDNIFPVPSCGSNFTVATGVTGNEFDFLPPSTGLWRFRVRAMDAENQSSAWSNSRDRTIETLTAVDEPRVYKTNVGANYPNPFNPSTRIPFVVGGSAGAGQANVVLAVYSVTGARVATLVREARRPGTYVAYWNGLDDAGRAAASGIYFARLEVGNTTVARKLVLLK